LEERIAFHQEAIDDLQLELDDLQALLPDDEEDSPPGS
jgi:hypothetical protein